MKAAIYEKFGPPDVLHVAEVETPTPQPGEVLIRVRAAAVAAEDPGFRQERGFNGIVRPRQPILGIYVAGDVTALGEGVTRFAVGDRVYAATGLSMGAYAEYKAMPADGVIGLMPDQLSYTEAVAIPNGALTALIFLRDDAPIQPGQRVLINGASGAVGSAAVMLAKHYGAHVTGVCSTANVDLVRALGADQVIDYTAEDFTRSGETYDVIFDAVNKRSFAECKPALTDHGLYLTTGPEISALFQTYWPIKPRGKRAIFAATSFRWRGSDIDYLNTLIEAGALKPVIDRCYPLDEIAEAHRYVETGRKRGNVVITID